MPTRATLVAIACLLGCFSHTSLAGILWSIGTPDESSSEFKQWFHPTTNVRQIDFTDPAQDSVFRPGVSSPSTDWLAYQPGDANGQAGFRPHPRSIEFNLDSLVAGEYFLDLHLLAYAARLPWLEIAVNGERGAFFQKPRLSYGGGDPAVFFQPHYSTSLIRAWIPSRLLKPGRNRIVIVARDSSRERDDSRPYGFPWPGSSGIVYDAVQFRHEPNMDLMQPEVNVLPFYRNSAGGLMQEFDVRVPIRPGDASLQVSLEVGGQIWREKRTLEHTFGEALFLGRVAEFKHGSPATLTVEREGRGSETWRFTLNPARKWKLLVMPNAHLDVGYTDYAAKVSEVQARSIDRLIEITRQRPEFRFTLDGFWIVEEFLHGRRPKSVEAFIKLARSGNIAIPACYGSTFTGFASLENLVRSIYPSARFAREHGLPLTFSLNTDVPSYSWSYASVLASAGVSNFLAASDAYRGPLLLYNQLNERSPTWWEGPDGGRVLTWWSRHYHQAGSLFSFPLNLTAGRESLPRFLQAYDHPHRTTDVALIYGTQVENVDIHAGQADLVGLWNREYAYPELQYAGFGEAMEMMRRLESDPSKFPVTRGDTGPYWEDGLGANAKATSGHRSNMVRILSAEVLGAAALSTGSGFKPDIRTLEGAWQRLLLTDEHSWHADCSVREPHSHQSLRQGDEKDARVQEASRMIDALLSRSMSALSDSISVPAGTLVVFNTLSWDRDGWVEHDINRGSRIIDLSTGKPVPMEAIGEGRQIQRVRFLAAGVPAAGYRCYAIRPGPAPVRAPEPLVGNMAESPFYRLIIDPATGNIRSLYDKQAERELIATNSAHSFAQALYVSGGDSLPNRLVQFSSVTPVPELLMHRPLAVSPAILLKSELGVEFRGDFSLQKIPRYTLRVRLPYHARRVEIEHTLTKEQTFSKEALYLAFPFSMDSPRFRWASQNGWIDPERDLMTGGSQEWFCMHEWLVASGDGFHVGVSPMDAPLMAIGDIVRGTWPRSFGKRPAYLFSYVMNNYTPEGYKAAQGGEFRFRTALWSGKEDDPVAWHRLGKEYQTPLEVNEIMRNDKLGTGNGRLPAEPSSLLRVSSPNVSLVTWKVAEDDGSELVLRFVEIAGKTGKFRCEFPFHTVLSVGRCNALEQLQTSISPEGNGFAAEARPFEIITLRLRLESRRFGGAG